MAVAVTAASPSPSRRVPMDLRDGPTRTRRACHEASSVAQVGCPLAAGHARARGPASRAVVVVAVVLAPSLAARRMRAARERRARARGGRRRRASPSRTPHRARTQHTQRREQRARQRRRCMRAAGRRWDGTSRTRQHARGARGTRERALAPGADARRATRTSVSFDTPREGSQSPPPARPAAPPLPSRTGRGRAPVARPPTGSSDHARHGDARAGDGASGVTVAQPPKGVPPGATANPPTPISDMGPAPLSGPLGTRGSAGMRRPSHAPRGCSTAATTPVVRRRPRASRPAAAPPRVAPARGPPQCIARARLLPPLGRPTSRQTKTHARRAREAPHRRSRQSTPRLQP